MDSEVQSFALRGPPSSVYQTLPKLLRALVSLVAVPNDTECPLCYIAFFSPNHVALSPPVPVLDYTEQYLANTEIADQLPLYELFQLLRNRVTVNLPDPTRVLPYLDLFSLVILEPTAVTGLCIPTLYQPRSFALQNNQFRPTRTRAASSLIFDVVATAGDSTVSHGLIPLSPEQPESNVQRYWRLPINTEIVLAILFVRNSAVPLPIQNQSRELTLARRISARLRLQGGGGRGGGCGGGRGRGGRCGRGGRGRGRGGHAGGGGNNGNGAAGTSKTREKGEPVKKKRRTVAPNEDLGLGFFIEERVERARNQSLSTCERPHYGVHPKEWDVATTYLTLADEQAKAYSGQSTPSNRESDCGEDGEWRFGPLFSSDMIIATARQMMDMRNASSPAACSIV